MRALVVIAHYFKARNGSIYSSEQERLRQQRQASIEQVVQTWRGFFGTSATIDIAHKRTKIDPTPVDKLDICVLVNDSNHLLTPEFEKACNIRKINVRVADTRYLPFGAHRLMAESRKLYDWFVYSEDDILLRDALLFRKLEAFQARFGPSRILQPNRYEMNPRSWRIKTYIDGDLRGGFIEPYLKHVEERAEILLHESELGTLTYARARNPHSGFFALNAEQLAHWTAQPSFLDLDCSFVSPLESAATLSLLKAFSLYKTTPPYQSYFEMEHLDTKFSNLRLPVM